MQTKKVQQSKPNKPLTQAVKPEAELKAEAEKESGFRKSRALSHQEVVELKEQLEDLNRSNTTGG